MSIEAMQWAFSQDIKPSSVKFVLVTLGDHADADGVAWPSIASISQKTGQDRKTVMSALDRLDELEYLKDTGNRKGATGQVKVYKFNFERDNSTNIGTVEPVDNPHNSTENGTIEKIKEYRISTVTVPFFPTNSTVIPPNSTENGTRKPKNPKRIVMETKYDAMADLEKRGVDKKTASDWLALRKRKKAEVTETAIDGVEREAVRAGMSLDDALKYCCTNGYQGFNASWIKKPVASDSNSKLGKAGQVTANNAARWLEEQDAT